MRIENKSELDAAADGIGIAPLPPAIERLKLAGVEASAEFVVAIPIAYARQHLLLGLAGNGDTEPLRVAMARFDDLGPLQIVSRLLNRRVTPVLASEPEILSAINAAYQERSGQAQTLIQGLERREVLAEVRELAAREDLLDGDSRAPVIKLVNLILFEAVKQNASDVHVQPYEESVVVRTRIDGLLYDSFQVPKGLQDEIISRLKVMGRMNIAEKRLPQDGRATVQVGDRVIDLRIASLPTRFGERVVIRVLDKSRRLFSLGEVGMNAATVEPFRRLIGSEHGIILVTGPTGSGKTTTLYAALQEINAKERNIITLEDPVEYGLEGISQTQVSDKKGLTFASGLRNVLRQDPDVIMVGEIRDGETATMAIQSALTGHLVFSTLHTNDACSAVARLLDLGVEPYLVASSVIGVLAQRLVRRVCEGCAKPYRPTADELAAMKLQTGAEVGRIRVGAGCAACRGTGYRGRVGVFEILLVNDGVRREITSRSSASEIEASAVACGMRTLHDDGVARVLEGVTTLSEVARVTMTREA